MTEGTGEARSNRTPHRAMLGSLLLIIFGFTLTTTAYLAWLYHLMGFVPPEAADALTMIGGYSLQAAGIGIVEAIERHRPGIFTRVSFVLVVALHFACAVPAILGTTLAGTLAFGYLMNVLCGMIAAYYLFGLSSWVPARRRGIVFGGGYACSILISWLLSRIAPAGSGDVLATLLPCLALSLLAVAVAFLPIPGHSTKREPQASRHHPEYANHPESRNSSEGVPGTEPSPIVTSRTVFAFACFAVLLMSLVKNVGFSFPAADIASGVNLELSRLFYAVGLVVAGIVVDRSRKAGTLCCLAALVTPFICMALANEPVSGTVMWAVDYFFYGFFSVFRIVLFADIAAGSGKAHLSGFGLMVGRIGDAAGTAVCMTLGDSTIALVSVAAVLFATAVFVVSRFIQLVFQPVGTTPKSNEQVFDEFSTRYDLSSREREVMRLLLAERSNAEIAAELFVTESTVKFHVGNLLKKTGCGNRKDLRATYARFNT